MIAQKFVSCKKIVSLVLAVVKLEIKIKIESRLYCIDIYEDDCMY